MNEERERTVAADVRSRVIADCAALLPLARNACKAMDEEDETEVLRLFHPQRCPHLVSSVKGMSTTGNSATDLQRGEITRPDAAAGRYGSSGEDASRHGAAAECESSSTAAYARSCETAATA